MVDAGDSKSPAERRVGSNPTPGTKFGRKLLTSLIHLSEGVWAAQGFLTQNEAESLVHKSERHGYEPAQVRVGAFADHNTQSLPNIRNNEKCIIELPNIVADIWTRLQKLPLPVLEDQIPVGLPSTLRFYKYSPGQRFKMHKDGAWQENGFWSRLTLLIYLNDDVDGGATNFKTITIKPQTGTLVLFKHKTWHEGTEVISGTKYVLRSDVLYGPK